MESNTDPPLFLYCSSSSRQPLRLILMSATMDAAKVARYFQQCNLPVGIVSASSGGGEL